MTRIPPTDCRSMDELRRQIDNLDRDMVSLLAERAGYIDRASELKPAEGLPARIDNRVEEVIGNVRASGEDEDLDADLVEAVWRLLIEWSIQREEAVLGPEAA